MPVWVGKARLNGNEKALDKTWSTYYFQLLMYEHFFPCLSTCKHKEDIFCSFSDHTSVSQCLDHCVIFCLGC